MRLGIKRTYNYVNSDGTFVPRSQRQSTTVASVFFRRVTVFDSKLH